MIYVKIQNGIITERISSSEIVDGYELDINGKSVIGLPRSWYTEKWELKELKELVDTKLISIPEGQKLSDNGKYFVDMSYEEKVEAQFILPTEYQTYKDGKIVDKEAKVLLLEGLISVNQYNTWVSEERRKLYKTSSDSLFWKYQEGKCSKQDWIDAKNKIREQYKKAEEL